MHINAYVSIHMHTNVCVHIYPYACICMYMYPMYICICKYKYQCMCMYDKLFMHSTEYGRVREKNKVLISGQHLNLPYLHRIHP